MENRITHLLLLLGIRSTCRGFCFIRYALILCLAHPEYLMHIYKYLYTDIGKKFHTSPGNVEHCMRTAVSHCWYQGNRSLLVSMAGYELDGKPTNGDFIDILYHHLTLSQ